MSETRAPRVWIAGNPEPSDVRLRVRDKHGDIWTPEQVLGGVRAWSTPETALATWDYLAKKWGPLTEVFTTSLGVSGGDRSKPTPARLPGCWCARCHPATGFRVMNLCPDCGNKRCPRATHHIHECTGSNEPGQPGSDYANIRRIERVAADPPSEVVTPEGPA